MRWLCIKKTINENDDAQRNEITLRWREEYVLEQIEDFRRLLLYIDFFKLSQVDFQHHHFLLLDFLFFFPMLFTFIVILYSYYYSY